MSCPPNTERTNAICDKYRRGLANGECPTDVVGYLAADCDVQRPAIWKALRRGGVLPPYLPKVKGGGGRPRSAYTIGRRTISEIEAAAVRVDRDPCQRCGVRHDIGCRHNLAPVGMMFG